MRLFSYVVARDYGFAPNPFHGWCTLATCKPVIRRVAAPGDWVLGTGSTTRGRQDRVVYAMLVSEVLTYNEYWSDQRFRAKRPNLRGSLKHAYGDNIYHRSSPTSAWQQEDSHHSFPEGQPNPANVDDDTKTDRVLVAEVFTYWGGAGPLLPDQFRDPGRVDIRRAGRGHRSEFPEAAVQELGAWLGAQPRGYSGKPLDW